MAHKSEEYEDLRIRRTRRLLQEALFKLTVEKGFAAATVRDIANCAMVNRSTFYRHYLDKYDLLNQYMDELEVRISGAVVLPENPNQPLPKTAPAALLVLVRHVQEYADFYRAMLGHNGDQVFTHRFRQIAEQRYRYLFSRFGEEADPKAPPIEMKLSYISAAGVGAILWWLENGQPCAAEELTMWLGQFSLTVAGLPLRDSTAELSPRG